MAVGSSSTMHFVSMAMTPAMATRCFCPPESLWGACSRYSYMSTALRAASTRRRISAGGTPRFSGPKATSSSTMPATSWLSGFCCTRPTRLRTANCWDSSAVSMPSTRIFPAVGSSMPLKSLAMVDFPQPLWPNSATNCPSSMERSTPWSTSLASTSLGS